jgi:hypothetical protein
MPANLTILRLPAIVTAVGFDNPLRIGSTQPLCEISDATEKHFRYRCDTCRISHHPQADVESGPENRSIAARWFSTMPSS